MTRAYLYSPSCPNGIAFLNTVLLFVNNHGNCKMICLCVHIHQNGHQDSSTFKVMIEKLTVSSGPSQFCVTDLTFICKSHVRHRQSQVRHVSSGPSRAIFFLDKCVKYSKICLSNYINQNNNFDLIRFYSNIFEITQIIFEIKFNFLKNVTDMT